MLTIRSTMRLFDYVHSHLDQTIFSIIERQFKAHKFLQLLVYDHCFSKIKLQCVATEKHTLKLVNTDMFIFGVLSLLD